MIRSVIIYVFIFILLIFLSYSASKRDRISKIIPIIVILTFIAGFRNYNVGVDTSQYVEKFNEISAGRLENAYGLENSFKYLCKFLLDINDSPTFLFLIFALLTNLLIVIRLWDYRKVSNFTMMIVCYYCTFYFFTFNIMRQMCGVAIIFFFTRYLEKGNYLKFLLGIIIAYFFHNSSLIGLLFFIPEYTKWKSLNRFQKVFLTLILLITPWSVKLSYNYLNKYFHYLDNINYKIGYMLILKLIIYCFFVVVVFIPKGRLYNLARHVYIDDCAVYYGIGIVFTALGYLFPYMERIGIIFYLFEGCFWGRVVSIKKDIDKYIYTLCLSAILLFYLYGVLFIGGQGQLPYSFIWEYNY